MRWVGDFNDWSTLFFVSALLAKWYVANVGFAWFAARYTYEQGIGFDTKRAASRLL
jgi:hypothetical protein